MEKDTTDKKKTASKKDIKTKTETGQKASQIELNPEMDSNRLAEDSNKPAVFTFGRMNPPTIGHEKLIKKVEQIAKSQRSKPHIFVSHTSDKKKNPLLYADKIEFLSKAYGTYPNGMVVKTKAKDIIAAMKQLESMGHPSVTLVVGSDRVRDFETLLNKYNGKEYNFDEINVVSAGDRDPDAEGAAGMSATKVRQAAADNDFNTFKRGIASSLKSVARDIFDRVRAGLQLAEELEEFLQLEEERKPLTIAQRRKKAMVMRRYKGKIKRSREIAKKRLASPEKLKTRSRRHAIQMVRKKFAAKRGENYRNLSPGDKIAIDRIVQKKAAIVNRIAKRLLPKEKKAELVRLRQARSSKKEEFEFNEDFNNVFVEVKQDDDISNRAGTQPAKYHKGLSPATKAKRDAQFKKQARMSDDNPAAYKPAPGDATAKTKPSKYTKAYHDMYSEAAEHEITVGSYTTTHFHMCGSAIKTMKMHADVDGAEQITKMQDQFYKFEKQFMDKEPTDSDKAKAQRMYDQIMQKSKEVGIEKDVGSYMKMHLNSILKGDPKPGFGMVNESEQQMRTKERHKDEKERLKLKHDREMDRARTTDTATANRAESFEITEDNIFESVDMILEELQDIRINEAYELSEKSANALADKSKNSGIPVGTLRKVYNRGVAAWKTGHRPGTTPQQWGYARVNAFIAKKKKGNLNHDKDLAHFEPQGDMIPEEDLQGYIKSLTPAKKKTSSVSDYMKMKDMLRKKRLGIKTNEEFDEMMEGKTADLIKKSHSERGAPGTLKAKIKGPITIDKVKALKNKPDATTLDKKQANFYLNMHGEETSEGLWDNIRKKRARGEKMRNKGDEGAPTPDQIKRAQEDVNESFEDMLVEQLQEQNCCGCSPAPIEEAEVDGKKVKLNDPIRTSEVPSKKFKVYVKDPSTGNIKTVRFGDPNLSIKRDDPNRRKSFRARHNCADPGPKTKARYWSCFQWRAGSKVDN
jgi:nicotinic acid mononucleotide adenylyltransferase